MAGNFDAHLVDETQGSHGHAVVEHGFVDILHPRAGFEKASGFDQVGHENAVDEEAGAVLDHDRQLANLLDKTDGALEHFGSGLFGHDYFHQLHAMHRVEEMDADDTLRMPSGGGDLRN